MGRTKRRKRRRRRARRTGTVEAKEFPSYSPSSSSSSSSTASDESFRRKLLKHLGSSSDPTTERVRVKEDDRTHIPHFPKPEQYTVRDAVFATSD